MLNNKWHFAYDFHDGTVSIGITDRSPDKSLYIKKFYEGCTERQIDFMFTMFQIADQLNLIEVK
jgi:hypothetical protein